ncbi:hypothetical protein KAW50_02220 [candidate division WOR-3 bacterium]|nr:hypothetical protein [candidate division WOR-3 bacterium]
MKKLFFTVVIVFLSTAIYGGRSERVSPSGIVVEHKSQKKTIALSLLLPGLGEQYMGHKKSAIRAYAIEATIWSAFFGARWYAGVLKDDYILHAHSNSGALIGKEEDYYDAVEWYPNLEAYNLSIREDARAMYSEIEAKEKYIEEHSLSDTVAWKWADEQKWDEYRELRKKKRSVLQNASYCVGVAILNRVASAIIATHLPESGFGLQIEPNGIKIRFALR